MTLDNVSRLKKIELFLLNSHQHVDACQHKRDEWLFSYREENRLYNDDTLLWERTYDVYLWRRSGILNSVPRNICIRFGEEEEYLSCHHQSFIHPIEALDHPFDVYKIVGQMAMLTQVFELTVLNAWSEIYKGPFFQDLTDYDRKVYESLEEINKGGGGLHE